MQEQRCLSFEKGKKQRNFRFVYNDENILFANRNAVEEYTNIQNFIGHSYWQKV